MTDRAPGTGTRTARRAVVQASLAFLEREAGEEAVTRVLAAMAPDHGELALQGDAEEVSLDQVFRLWRVMDRELEHHEGWMERAGAFSIESTGRDQYGGIVGKTSPLEFLTQRISLFRLYYRCGRMEVVRHGEGEAVLRLVDFGPSDPLFCARQTGGLQRALALAQGGEPQVRHVRCAHEGDAFCEWRLRWGAPEGGGSASARD
ncbi:MAG: hypothetical protein EA422_04495 [Gemmatimonadales bacterium]|nr:MAG: hypothetical protein EA422_04495 [Gemmatimonadales bacterium]